MKRAPLAPGPRPCSRALLSLAVLLAGAGALGCRGSNEAVLLLVVTASGSPPGIVALDVTLMEKPGSSSSARYPQIGGDSITFPTTLAARLPANAAGPVKIDVRAINGSGATVASGHAGPVDLRAGEQRMAYVQLKCGSEDCVTPVDPSPDGGAPNPSCGNGHVDPGETCDTAILPRDPGACPQSDCDDRVPCTVDGREGDGCNARCTHTEIRERITGDGCCPSNSTYLDDADCSPTCGDGVVDRGETCDTAIAGGAPGACPTVADCDDGEPCAYDLLPSAGTCAAICVHYPVGQKAGDHCCPPGSDHNLDVDCPVACGNGAVESSEICDVGILSPAPGSCPLVCADPSQFVTNSGCDARCIPLEIKAPVSGDGYCFPGATHSSDSDCPSKCPNGVVEPGEACDPMALGDGSCPMSCAPLASACLLVSLVSTAKQPCSARCEITIRTSCSPSVEDGCCPEGCTRLTDLDCSPSCGDGIVQGAAKETCDIAIPAGQPGACPTACADANPCTQERLLGAGTCAAVCVFIPIRAFRPGDGCCPSGADFNVDPDCRPLCGNGVVESPAERCDYAVAGSCPTGCTFMDACTPFVLRGNAASCSAMCVPQPITACANGDGCCPAGCTTADDGDCRPICGDRVIDGSVELCDRGITAGFPGACPYSCDDADACTVDLVSGTVEGCSRACLHHRVTACLAGDSCCPRGCTPATDADCKHSCGDGTVGAEETCDPSATCPTSCPDDGDPCTREQLSGTPTQCNVACRHIPITACSAGIPDRCCPNGCTHATDGDC